jgi:hypothetical protein
MQGKSKSGERSVNISLEDQERNYLSGHVIGGRNLFPGVAYLVSCRLQYVTSVVVCFLCVNLTIVIFTFYV